MIHCKVNLNYCNFIGTPIVPKLAISSPPGASSSPSSPSSSDPPLTAIRTSVDNQKESKSLNLQDKNVQILSGIFI